MDATTQRILLEAFLEKRPIPLSTLVGGGSGVHGSIMSTSAAGRVDAVRHPEDVRLVIYSRHGRFVSPFMADPGQMQILLHSRLSQRGFNVIGKGIATSGNGGEYSVWFMSEIA